MATARGAAVTLEFFRAQMRRLMGLRFAPADFDTHWEALKDLPDAVLEAAVSRAQKTRTDFPTPIELRVDADAVAHRVRTVDADEDQARVLETPVELGTLPTGRVVKATREWKYYCDVCGDIGWRSLWCGEPLPEPFHKPWMSMQHCGRKREHLAHEWVTDCACAQSNPAILRRKANQQRYADTAAEKKKTA